MQTEQRVAHWHLFQIHYSADEIVVGDDDDNEKAELRGSQLLE